MLSEPAFIACLDGRDSQRVAFLAKQCISAIPGTEGPDFAGFREVADVFVLGVAWPRCVLLVWSKWCSDRMQALYKIPVRAQGFQDLDAHARHDVHVHNDIWRVGD